MHYIGSRSSISPSDTDLSAGDCMDYRKSHLDQGLTYDQALEADAFDGYMDEWEGRYVRQWVRSAFPSTIPRYLDFACGTGRITAVVAPLARSVVGVDVSESMLEVARTKVPSATFLNADLTTNSHDFEPFDLVTAFRFFGNADVSLRGAALNAINRLQAVGSFLVMNNHRNPNGLAHWLGSLRGAGPEMDLTHGRLRRLLSAHGYSIRHAWPIGVWQYRAKLMRSAGSDPEREERLETLLSTPALCHIAPDCVIVAQKARDIDS